MKRRSWSRLKKVEQQRLEQNKKQQAHEIEAKYMRQITRTRLTRRRSLIAARNRMVDDVFLQAAKKLAEFAASKEYPSYLQKRVTNALDEFPCETAVLTVPQKSAENRKTVCRCFAGHHGSTGRSK